MPQKYKPREKPRSEVRQKKLWDIQKPDAENPDELSTEKDDSDLQ